MRNSPISITNAINRQRYSAGGCRSIRNQSWNLWLAGGAIAGIVLLPVLYLLVRVADTSQNTWELVFQATTLHTLGRSLGLAITVSSASAVIAVPLAWLTTRTDLPLRKLWFILGSLPMVIPSYVGAYLMVASLGPRGVISQFLTNTFGITHLPAIYGFTGAAYLLTLLSYPYTLLSVRAALQGMDPALEEAARSLGHTRWSTFWRVTLPQLRPAIALGSLLIALYVLRDFGAVSIMRYNTFTRVIYLQYSTSFDRASAAAFSLVLITLTVSFVLFEQWQRKRNRMYASSAHKIRNPSTISLGRWRWPALFFCSGIAILGLFIPASVLAYWLWRGLLVGENMLPVWVSTSNSVLVSLLAAAATVLAGLPIAYLGVRYPGRASRGLESVAHIAFALPGIVIALALVFFTTNFALPFYQTLPVLVLAYGILYLSQAVSTQRTALLQIPPGIEEAARSLGRNPRQVLATITLPIIRPGILTGFGLVFLTAMKELPATLILSPIGFKTLAMQVWSAVSEAFFAQAALPALILIGASSIPLAVLALREQK